jgi:ribosomal protein S18 acetylase RimI-like enzyme
MVVYQVGIPETMRDEAMALYDAAFGAKFAVAIRNPLQRRAIVAESLDLKFGIAAISDGELVGLAGFHTADGSLTGGMTARRLFSRLGVLRGLWAAMIFSLYERSGKSAELLMDGIAVKAGMRGRRIGTTLLDYVKRYAREYGYRGVRLDVIDTNPAARRLYERQGFVATETEHFGYLRWLLGFGASTTMVYVLQHDG